MQPKFTDKRDVYAHNVVKKYSSTEYSKSISYLSLTHLTQALILKTQNSKTNYFRQTFESNCFLKFVTEDRGPFPLLICKTRCLNFQFFCLKQRRSNLA